MTKSIVKTRNVRQKFVGFNRPLSKIEIGTELNDANRLLVTKVLDRNE